MIAQVITGVYQTRLAVFWHERWCGGGSNAGQKSSTWQTSYSTLINGMPHSLIRNSGYIQVFCSRLVPRRRILAYNSHVLAYD